MRAHPYIPAGPVVVTKTRRLFAGRDKLGSHFTFPMPGHFASRRHAIEFIAKLAPGEYRIEVEGCVERIDRSESALKNDEARVRGNTESDVGTHTKAAKFAPFNALCNIVGTAV